MSADDVLDLVAKHTGQLTHPVRALEHAAVHVHHTTRQREGVHDVAVDDVELPWQIRARRRFRDLSAELIDVLVDLRIPHERELRIDLLRLL